MRAARDLWTPAEDAEIVERYAEGGAAAVLPHVAPHRTVEAVLRRASLLKVRRKSVFSHPKKPKEPPVVSIPFSELRTYVRLRRWGRYEGAPRGHLTPMLGVQG
jgi:hypothetical protein